MKQVHALRIAYEETFLSTCLVRGRAEEKRAAPARLPSAHPLCARKGTAIEAMRTQEYEAMEKERAKATQAHIQKYLETVHGMQPTLDEVR